MVAVVQSLEHGVQHHRVGDRAGQGADGLEIGQDGGEAVTAGIRRSTVSIRPVRCGRPAGGSEPPPSVPIAAGTIPAATPAAAPPDEPPE